MKSKCDFKLFHQRKLFCQVHFEVPEEKEKTFSV